MLENTKQQMAALRLYGMIAALDEQILHPPQQLSFEERFALLIERESLHRENQRLANRLKQAQLKNASLEAIDFSSPRDLNKSQLLTFSQGAWLHQKRSIIITGPTGTGKTFIACALAHKACLLGFTSKYYRLLHLIHDITIAYRESKLSRFLFLINKLDVLIIDDFGMMIMDDEQKRLLFEILEHRYEIKSTIITSQLPINHWYDYLNDPLIADALLDRIVHLSEKISLSGESLRKVKSQTTLKEDK
jgi:DNA replication protein DnaC